MRDLVAACNRELGVTAMRRPPRFAARLVAIALAAIALPASAGFVTKRPLAQHRVAAVGPAVAPRNLPAGPHTVFGTIVGLHGGTLLVRLRTGRSIAVNASSAIANGTVSAPLFIGKAVVTDGSVYGGTLIAVHVYAVTRLTASPPDR